MNVIRASAVNHEADVAPFGLQAAGMTVAESSRASDRQRTWARGDAEVNTDIACDATLRWRRGS
eukprot:4977275-Pleurochrysis_carterae.AAC.1